MAVKQYGFISHHIVTAFDAVQHFHSMLIKESANLPSQRAHGQRLQIPKHNAIHLVHPSCTRGPSGTDIHTDDSEEGLGGLDAACGTAGFAVVETRLPGLQVSQDQVLLVLEYIPVQQSPIVVPERQGRPEGLRSEQKLLETEHETCGSNRDSCRRPEVQFWMSRTHKQRLIDVCDANNTTQLSTTNANMMIGLTFPFKILISWNLQ